MSMRYTKKLAILFFLIEAFSVLFGFSSIANKK